MDFTDPLGHFNHYQTHHPSGRHWCVSVLCIRWRLMCVCHFCCVTCLCGSSRVSEKCCCSNVDLSEMHRVCGLWRRQLTFHEAKGYHKIITPALVGLFWGPQMGQRALTSFWSDEHPEGFICLLQRFMMFHQASGDLELISALCTLKQIWIILRAFNQLHWLLMTVSKNKMCLWENILKIQKKIHSVSNLFLCDIFFSFGSFL